MRQRVPGRIDDGGKDGIGERREAIVHPQAIAPRIDEAETGDLWPAGMHGHTRVKASTFFGKTGPSVQNVDVLVAKSTNHGYSYGDSKTFTTSGNSTDDRPWQKRRQWRQQRTVDGSVRFKITLSSDDGGAYDAILSGITIEHLPEPGGVRLGSSDRG